MVLYASKHKGPRGRLRYTLHYKKNHVYWLVTQIHTNTKMFDRSIAVNETYMPFKLNFSSNF